MKYYPKLGIYKNSTGTCQYNPTTLESLSYGWWQMSRAIDVNGETLIVFNNHTYSHTTTRHQYKVRSRLPRIDLTVEVAEGLQHPNWLELAIEALRQNIKSLEAEIDKPRSRLSTNLKRMKAIHEIELKLATLTHIARQVAPTQRSM